jgi:hypothetical protein
VRCRSRSCSRRTEHRQTVLRSSARFSIELGDQVDAIR